MGTLIERNRREIEIYCDEYGLDFSKISRFPYSLNENGSIFRVLYYDAEHGRLELEGKRAPEPCPCLLVITEAPVGLVFEQTEHTMKYLGIGSSCGLAGIGTHDI